MKKSLAKVLKNYPGVTMGLKRPEIKAPFECIVHRWDKLLAEREALAERKKNESLTAEEATELQVCFGLCHSSLCCE